MVKSRIRSLALSFVFTMCLSLIVWPTQYAQADVAYTGPTTAEKSASSRALPNLLFSPEGPCGQVWGISGFNGYSDVSEHAWYCDPLAYLRYINAAQGYTNGTFGPNNWVTRGAFAKMLVIGFDYPLEPASYGTPVFADVPMGHEFYVYAQTAWRYNLMTGKPGVAGFVNYCMSPPQYEDPSKAYFRWCYDINRG